MKTHTRTHAHFSDTAETRSAQTLPSRLIDNYARISEAKLTMADKDTYVHKIAVM